jgi:hypothetical protein
VNGRRVYPHENGELPLLEPGDYCSWHGVFFCATPNGLQGSLAKHLITEHEDGTITVSPSILVRGTLGTDPRKLEWHGYLERGVWRSC